MLNKVFKKYYNYINVFNKLKTNILLLYRFYNYKMKFIKKKKKHII